MRLLYNLFWLLILPFITVGFLLNSRGRLRIRERFGIHAHSLHDIKILAHGASVGEVFSLIPILTALGVSFDKVLLTGTSVTGLAEGEKRGFTKNLLLPIDLLFFLNRSFSDIQPEICLISESDVWPGMISYFSKYSKIIYVNGRFRFSIFKKYSPLYVSSLKKVTLFLVENKKSKEASPSAPSQKIA